MYQIILIYIAACVSAKCRTNYFEIVKGNLKKNCHKREILGYPPALPPADSDTIYSFSGQSRL